MEKLLLGNNIKDKDECGEKGKLCDFYAIVQKGHEECGDSAFAYTDDKVIFAVLDGVSGEPGAASASSIAAITILETLKTKKLTEKAVKEAVIAATRQISHGLTTLALVFIDKKGSFIMASVGDSPIYGISKGKIGMEIPLGRPVNSGDSLLKFLSFRNLVTSVLGPSGVDIELHMKKGKLKKGEMVILASDGLSDNLYLITTEGYVTDASGSKDLKELIGASKDPKAIVKKLMKEVQDRISKGKIEKNGKVLVPKVDDIAIIALRWL